MLRFLTAGESHGKCLVGIVEGLPRGLAVDIQYIDAQLRRRQLGYGRGGRMNIELDQIEILSGVRLGFTIGSPVSYMVRNKDWENWRDAMSIEKMPDECDVRSVVLPRPGHADLAGALKYQTYDVRDILERASARETAARVGAGSLCRLLLSHFKIEIGSHVVAIGSERIAEEYENMPSEKIFAIHPESAVRCLDPAAESRMTALIDAIRESGDSLGGIVEVVGSPVPPGLGSHIQWDRRLDGMIAQAMMSIPSVKAVEIGSGISAAKRTGSTVHDPISYDSRARRFYREKNDAGGLEGGISNGSDIRLRIYLKPIPTLRSPLGSVNIQSKSSSEAVIERSDCCVVPAAGVIAESMLSLILAAAFLEKFGGDSLKEVELNYANYVRMLDEY